MSDGTELEFMFTIKVEETQEYPVIDILLAAFEYTSIHLQNECWWFYA